MENEKMSKFEKSLDTCSQCRFCRQISDGGDGNPRWICSAKPPAWDGVTDPNTLSAWVQPQVEPGMGACRYFECCWTKMGL